MPVPSVLYGNSFADGTATNNNSSDAFQVYGPLNQISTHGGNEMVTGGTLAPFGQDNATTVFLGVTPQFPESSGIGVTDTISLHGGNNIVEGGFSNANPLTNPALLANSTVTITVSGADVGGNLVNVLNVTNPLLPGTLPAVSTVTLTGSNNQVYLSDYATDTVSFDLGFNYVKTGVGGDGALGFNSTFYLAGNANQVTTGDSNDTITGADSNNQLLLGNGNNTVTLSGTTAGGNFVKVGDGNNEINTGTKGNSIVEIDQFGTAVAGSDYVVIGGMFNAVIQATTGKSDVSLSGGTGHNSISLGNGNNDINIGGGSNGIVVGNGRNTIELLSSAGFNGVSGGNGVDTAEVNGPGNVIQFGNGNDLVQTTGNSNQIALGNGNNEIDLGAGIGNAVSFGSGNNVVTGTIGGGNNLIVGGDIPTSTVTITLDSQSGNSIGLQNGTDTVTDYGNNNTLTAGNGNDTVTFSNPGLPLTLEGGNNDSITLGIGNDTVFDNGTNDTITLGTAAATTGENDTLTAVGSGDTITVYGHDGTTPSTTTALIGATTTYNAFGGIQDISAGNVAPATPAYSGDNDTINLNNVLFGSTTNLFGNNDTVNLTNNSTTTITTGASNSGETIAVFGNTVTGAYTGQLVINNFGTDTDVIDLQGLKDAMGFTFNHLGTGPGGFDPTLNASNTAFVQQLYGGGSISFTAPVIGGFNATDVKFS